MPGLMVKDQIAGFHTSLRKQTGFSSQRGMAWELGSTLLYPGRSGEVQRVKIDSGSGLA